MRLGAMGYHEEVPWVYREVPFKVFKMVASLGGAWRGKLWGEEYEQRAIAAGLEPFIDLRFPLSLLRDKDLPKSFARFCALIAGHHTECRELSVWEEPNCPMGGTENWPAYVNLLRAAYEAIKEVRPDALVYNGGIGIHGDTWKVGEFVDSGGLCYTDAVNLHPYLYGDSKDEMLEQLTGFLGTVRSAIGSKPIVLSEYGVVSGLGTHASLLYSEGVEGLSDEDQASYLTSALNLFVANGVDLCVLFILDSANPSHWSHCCGLIREEGLAPKPSYFALKEWHQNHAS